jgi:hypothetical protein
METLTAFGIAFISGGGLVALFNWLTKRRLTKKQEKQTDVRTEEMAVNMLAKALETVNKQLVDPLKTEIERKDIEHGKILKSVNNEIAKLRRAIEKIPACSHAATCPVSFQLQNDKNSD